MHELIRTITASAQRWLSWFRFLRRHPHAQAAEVAVTARVESLPEIAPVVPPPPPVAPEPALATPPAPPGDRGQIVPFTEMPRGPELARFDEAAQKKSSRRLKETLSDLLDDIEYAHESAAMRDEKFSWASKDTRRALRRIGPHIGGMTAGEARRMVAADGDGMRLEPHHLASIVFLSWYRGGGIEDTDPSHWSPMVAFYAVKTESRNFDASVERPGPDCLPIIYECGAAYRLSTGRLMWVNWFMHVRNDGTCRTANRLYHQDIAVCRPGSSRPVGWYPKRQWRKDVPQLVYHIEDDSMEARAKNHADEFVVAMRCWAIAKGYWKVAVTKDSRRVTWMVPSDQTPKYFADRSKTVSVGGRAKPIIHAVQEHDRITPSGKTVKVSEHVRGVDRFKWRGYDCHVMPPKRVPSQVHGFTLPARNVTRAEGKRPDMLSVAGLADRLVSHEEALH